MTTTKTDHIAYKCVACRTVNVLPADKTDGQKCIACNGNLTATIGYAVFPKAPTQLPTPGDHSRDGKKKKDGRMRKIFQDLKKMPGIITKVVWNALDVLLLIGGMALTSFGVHLIYKPAGFIMSGLCCGALAFFIAKKQARGGEVIAA